MLKDLRYKTFLAAARGLSAWQTAKIMGCVRTTGINWCGCTKTYMAEGYASGVVHDCSVSPEVIAALMAAPRTTSKKDPPLHPCKAKRGYEAGYEEGKRQGWAAGNAALREALKAAYTKLKRD